MSRKEFMNRLAFLLQDMPEEERMTALEYYNDYFDDAGEENEEEVIRELKSPERLASMIKQEAAEGYCGESGEFTEHGYRDSRYRSYSSYRVAERRPEMDGSQNTGAWTEYSAETEYSGYKEPQSEPKNSRRKRSGWAVLGIVCLVIFASPFILGIGSIAVGLLITLFFLLLIPAIVATVLAFAFVIAGVVCFGTGVTELFVFPLYGAVCSSVGLILFGVGLLFGVLCIWIYGKALPSFFRWTGRLFHRRRRSVA